MNIEIPDGELFRGQAATLLVEMATRYIQPRRRIIAVGRCVNGGAFHVTAPVQPPQDFADAIAEVLTPDRVLPSTLVSQLHGIAGRLGGS